MVVIGIQCSVVQLQQDNTDLEEADRDTDEADCSTEVEAVLLMVDHMDYKQTVEEVVEEPDRLVDCEYHNKDQGQTLDWTIFYEQLELGV